MTIEYANDVPMNRDFEGDWIDSVFKDTLTKRLLFLSSAQIYWTGAAGSPTGEIKVAASNNSEVPSILSVYTVDTGDNTSDAQLCLFEPYTDKVSFRFIHNSMTEGKLSIILNYSPFL